MLFEDLEGVWVAFKDLHRRRKRIFGALQPIELGEIREWLDLHGPAAGVPVHDAEGRAEWARMIAEIDDAWGSAVARAAERSGKKEEPDADPRSRDRRQARQARR